MEKASCVRRKVVCVMYARAEARLRPAENGPHREIARIGQGTGLWLNFDN